MRASDRLRVTETLDADVSADAVWSCLADARSYADWVVGTARIDRADPDWPAVGARLRHRFGPWPLRVRDVTEVVECVERQRLVLRAAARPWAVVRVEVLLAPRPHGVRVTVREEIVAGLATKASRPARWIQRWRNRRALRLLVARAAPR